MIVCKEFMFFFNLNQKQISLFLTISQRPKNINELINRNRLVNILKKIRNCK